MPKLRAATTMAPGIIITTTTSPTMNEAVLYNLLSWMSPAWPVGAFAHSGGLEWAVEDGLLTDRASTEVWLADWLDHGGGWTDAVLFSFAHRAVTRSDGVGLLEVAELALAVQTTAERRLEAVAQGAAFRKIARSTAGTPALALLDGVPDEELAYPIVVACLTAGHGAPLVWALTAYLHGVVANLSSAAQRLIPLGQTDGQLVIAALRERVAAVVARAVELEVQDPFEALGAAAFVADIASMAHETQYTRLFRT
ncbi:MAG: urease accessory UreF family protein [Caulobacteraceae bacterium]